MMKQSLSIVPVGTKLQWVNRADQSVAFAFDTSSVSNAVRDAVFAYGVKQIISDGGAVGVNVPMSERIAKMAKRAESLVDGTYGQRQSSGGLGQHAALYRLCVELELIADSEERRATFKKLPAAAIAKLYAREIQVEVDGIETTTTIADYLSEGAEDFLA
jgi:hypothetical protein